ncbi:MAG: hypothetical protein LBU16_07275 [Treponema sp.]|jgi:hypothetical protein|nr:hypothetical protein [Treponema sp.]
MKKIVALALVLSFRTTMVFAEPVVFASRLIQTTDLISEADLNDPLFADVEAPQLAAFEAEQVEGDGGPITIAALTLGGGALYAIVGAVAGAQAVIATYRPPASN